MADPIYGLQRKPGSLQQLSRFTKGWNSDMATFMLPLAYQDIFYQHFDFENDTITNKWTVSEKDGGSTVFASSTAGEYGTAIGATAATDNTMLGINYDGVFFDANRSPGMLVRMKVDVIANTYFEIGFCDAPTQAYDANWTVTTATAAPTLVSNGTTDIASIVIDTDATQKTAVLCAVGTTDTTKTLAVLSRHGFARNAIDDALSNYDVPGVSPLASDTYATFLIQLNAPAAAATPQTDAALASYQNSGSTVSACINGNPVLSNTIDVGPDTALKLRPYIVCGTRTAGAKTFTIDYISIWCNRQ